MAVACPADLSHFLRYFVLADFRENPVQSIVMLALLFVLANWAQPVASVPALKKQRAKRRIQGKVSTLIYKMYICQQQKLCKI